jgi:DNA mismatch repair protein MutL
MKIAAGEVIERPASVIKELVENSIDSGARNIRVEIKNGGLSLMRVSDDGCGIPFAEIPVAFERHATSKISEVEDLYRLTTLGFRGEALPSIAAVSQMTMLSRPRNSQEDGCEIAFEGGQRVYHRPAGSPPGTIVSVRNLFYNLPARQKWSRSGTSEAAHILNILNSYALAYPEIKFSLATEGRLVLQTNGNGDLRDAIAKVYGAELAQAMLPVSPGAPVADEDGVVQEETGKETIKVTGFTSDPAASKPNRNYMQFFVNRRWVQSRILTYAVQEAYTSLITVGRFPACVLLLEIDPAEVDVNVHPAKTEVRFLYERKIFGAVQKAVRAALLVAASIPVWGPEPVPASRPSSLLQTFERLYSPPAPPEIPPETPAPTPEQEQQSSMAFPANAAGVDLMDETAFESAPPVKPAPEQTAIKPEDAPMTRPRLPLLRVVGQVSTTYIVTEGPDGMYLIDQHAAHERIMYERFIALVGNHQVEAQLLLEPELLELTPRQRLLLENEEHRRDLQEMGFQLEPFGELTYRLRAVPAILFGRDAIRNLGEMLDEAEGVRDGGCNPTRSDLIQEPDTALPRTWRDRLAASLACHAAVRAGQLLTLEEMRALISQLERTENPRACAHGRPTMIHLSQGQLERGFGRK